MESQTKTKYDIIDLEIIFQDKSDIIKLASKEDFVVFILENSLQAITQAIEQDLEKITLFRILNLGILIVIDKANYSKVLSKMINHCLGQEDYDKCASIQKLIDKIK